MNPTDTPVISTGVLPGLVTPMCKGRSSTAGVNLLHTLTVNRGALCSENEVCMGDTRPVSMLFITLAFSSRRGCATSYYIRVASLGGCVHAIGVAILNLLR